MMYRVVHTSYVGLLGMDLELSCHRSKAQAFRSAHRFAKQYGRGVHVEDEQGNPVMEVKVKRGNRWVIV